MSELQHGIDAILGSYNASHGRGAAVGRMFDLLNAHGYPEVANRLAVSWAEDTSELHTKMLLASIPLALAG